MASVSEQLAKSGNRPAGFDYMRLVLASAVIVSHAWYAVSGRAVGLEWALPWRPLWGSVLPCFFALSGFLVAGSLERTRSLITFLGLRLIRLVPALAVETTLSALILGPIFTTVALSAYFTDHDFYRYFGNIVGAVHFSLPGVFKSNPSSAVNSQLWTLPFELACYITLSLFAAVGLTGKRTRWLLLAVLVTGQIVLGAHAILHTPDHLAVIKGRVMVCSFLAGLAIYKYRDRVPHNGVLFAVCCTLIAVLLSTRGGDDFLSLPAAYATVWLGTLNPRRSKLLLSGDYSYGLYLYGFPIQQAITATGTWAHHWWVNLLVAYPITLAFAVFSWRCVERPALGLKTILTHTEAAALRFPPLRWHSERIYQGNGREVAAAG